MIDSHDNIPWDPREVSYHESPPATMEEANLQGQPQFLLMAVLGAVKECSSLGADLVVYLWGVVIGMF